MLKHGRDLLKILQRSSDFGFTLICKKRRNGIDAGFYFVELGADIGKVLLRHDHRSDLK
ncbi:hypothetical protein D3C85_1364650 [compost metagenome]